MLKRVEDLVVLWLLRKTPSYVAHFLTSSSRLRWTYWRSHHKLVRVPLMGYSTVRFVLYGRREGSLWMLVLSSKLAHGLLRAPTCFTRSSKTLVILVSFLIHRYTTG